MECSVLEGCLSRPCWEGGIYKKTGCKGVVSSVDIWSRPYRKGEQVAVRPRLEQFCFVCEIPRSVWQKQRERRACDSGQGPRGAGQEIKWDLEGHVLDVTFAEWNGEPLQVWSALCFGRRTLVAGSQKVVGKARMEEEGLVRKLLQVREVMAAPVGWQKTVESGWDPGLLWQWSSKDPLTAVRYEKRRWVKVTSGG